MCPMNKKNISIRLFFLALLSFASTWTFADKQMNQKFAKDSLKQLTTSKTWKEPTSDRIPRSGYPVELKVKGHSLCVISKYEQVLPIYTKQGTLYLAMQLNTGVNWLNGLPCGRYQINDKTISIK